MKRLIRLFVPVMMAAASSACSLNNLADGTDVSSETIDPAAFRTPQGALAAYRSTYILLMSTMSWNGDLSSPNPIGYAVGTHGIVYVSGLLSDELQAQVMATEFPTQADAILDSRIGRARESDIAYEQLHKLRGMAQEARGMVREFLPNEWRDLSAHLYAIEGYATLLLADLFCSGIPLSQVNYKGDFTVTRGYTTAEVYERALALFDSAESSIRDSITLAHFINVGRGRALVAIGQYAQAANVVQHVPDTYRYELSYSSSFQKSTPQATQLVVADGNGGGIRFVSDHDPRATLPVLLDPVAPLTLASGIEARLIAVEAAVHANDANWIAGLNALRTTCTISTDCPVPAPSGIGNVGNLAPLIDSTQSLPSEERFTRRIDLLFRERAYWLFLTGHRQGDLRRLVREYGRNEQTVYPSGLWGSKGFSAYGTNTNFEIPDYERRNPLYDGCKHRDA